MSGLVRSDRYGYEEEAINQSMDDMDERLSLLRL